MRGNADSAELVGLRVAGVLDDLRDGLGGWVAVLQPRRCAGKCCSTESVNESSRRWPDRK
jgi:hypothetical protein